MKPISSLSALVLPVVSSSRPNSPQSSSKALAQNPLSQPLSMQLNPKNPSPDSNQSSTTNTTPSSQGDGMDRKLLGSKETSGSIMKSSPLSVFVTSNKVGSSFAGQQQRGLINYQQHQQPILNLPLPVNDRKVRDSGTLLFMLAFLGFLGYIIWDGIIVKETDINLIVHGHDSYGNICGRKNKPLNLVEKSGKNFTSKPYTKYTLINAQFERYTLDPERLKFGELIYIKEDALVPQNVSDRSRLNGTHELEQQAHEPASNQQTARNRGRIRFVRSTRVTSQQSEFEFETLKERRKQLYELKNQTALNILKSSLMYQYPPMYGYKESDPTHATHIVEDVSVNDTQHHVQKHGAQAPKTASSSLAYGRNQGKPTAIEFEQERQSPASNSSARASNGAMFQTHTAPTRPSSIHSEQLSTELATFSTPSSVHLKRTTTTSMVLFDDTKEDNDTGAYEHMLVDTSNSRRGNTLTPQILNHNNEIGNSLLYLTECVDQCPADHIELIFYRCMPKNWRFSLFPNAINVTRTFIDDIVTDISHCYRELIYIFSFALVLSVALLILLRYLASLIIWSCLVTLITLLLSMASYSWFSYYNQIIDLNNAMPHNSIYEERLASSDKWLIGAIFLTFITLATIGTIIFMRKRILLVTTLFKESGKAIADMPLLLLQPLFTFAALVSITILWSVGLICLQSMRIPVIDMTTGFVVFKAETLYKIMKWYHIFAFLWISHFAIACQHYVIGAAVSKWYFSTNRYNLHSPIGSSVSELILYYLGTVALGSFLVAIFKVVRIIIRQIQFLVQRNCMSTPSSNSGSISQHGSVLSSTINSTQMSTSCCGSLSYVWRLLIWFFDNIVMIINRDAYVEVAIYGLSFIGGAQKAFSVLASNPLKLLAIKSVSNVLLIVAKICVVFGTISMASLLMDEKNNQLNYSWSPIVISAIYAYVVAHWFLSVYEMVIDALFICYCEDYERSKNQEASAQITGSQFMSQVLTNNNQLF